MSLCCVPTCKAKKVKGGENSFHEFPSDLVLRQKWINIIFRNTPLDKVYKLSASSKVCSQHFTPDCYEPNPKKKRLKIGAIPTVFDGMSEVYVQDQDLLPVDKMPWDYKMCLEYQQQKSGKYFPQVKKTKLPKNLLEMSAVSTGGKGSGTTRENRKTASLYFQNETVIGDHEPQDQEELTCTDEVTVIDSEESTEEEENVATSSFDHDYYKRTSDCSTFGPIIVSVTGATPKKTFADAAVQVKVLPGRNLCRLVSNASVQAHIVNSKLSDEERRKRVYLTKTLSKYRKATQKLREKTKLLKYENAKFANFKKIMADAQRGELKALMLLEQCKAYGKKRHTWPEALIHHCFLIYYKSPALYRHFRKHYMSLPAPASLTKYVGENIGENQKDFFGNLLEDGDDNESANESETGEEDQNEEGNTSADENQENEPVANSEDEVNPEIEESEMVI